MLTESAPFQTGQTAPDFTLPNVVNGHDASLQELRGEQGTVVMFICNHCPFVIHVNDELIRLANDYQSRGIGFVAISSNYVGTHPQDGPEHMKRIAAELGYPFPYLYDESQDVARAYNAACTPDFYLFDADLKAVYHGQLDSSRPNNQEPLNGQDMRQAIEAMLKGESSDAPQRPSIGCNIKWKS